MRQSARDQRLRGKVAIRRIHIPAIHAYHVGGLADIVHYLPPIPTVGASGGKGRAHEGRASRATERATLVALSHARTTPTISRHVTLREGGAGAQGDMAINGSQAHHHHRGRRCDAHGGCDMESLRADDGRSLSPNHE